MFESADESGLAAAQRHFKDDVFSILVMTATNQEPGKFIAAYKNRGTFIQIITSAMRR